MRSIFLIALSVLAGLFVSHPLRAEPTEKRVALVIGNAAYPARPLATAANDAGLVAQTLQAAGFDVVGARDLDEDSLRHSFRDFLEKARISGPDTVAVVYFAGYGLQLEGENYLVPIDADIGPQSDAPSRSVRVSDLLRPLAALPSKLSIAVLDAARAGPFTLSGQPLAGGLALVEPAAKNMLLAFNAAPGTVAPDEKGPYGAYAQALAEMIRDGGLPLGELFERVRLRVVETTKGAQTPWNSAPIDTPFFFFLRTAQAPAPDVSSEQTASIASKPIRDLNARDAYVASLERDTLPAYQEFLAAYPSDPMAKRVRAIVAARREATIWRRTRVADTSAAYWTYLRRYPRGPHCGDARRRLTAISAALEPPPSFVTIDYDDVPPPPPEEIVFVERPILVFDDPYFALPPPPPVPVYFLPPPPPDFVVLPPPLVVVAPFVLPVPVFTPAPVWTEPPPYVAPPPNNFFFANLHNSVVVNETTNIVTVKDPGGHILSNAPLKTAATVAGAAALGAALPAVLARRAALQPQPGVAPGQAPGAFGRQPGPGPAPVGGMSALPPAPAKPFPGQPLPGHSPPGPSGIQAPVQANAPSRLEKPSPLGGPAPQAPAPVGATSAPARAALPSAHEGAKTLPGRPSPADAPARQGRPAFLGAVAPAPGPGQGGALLRGTGAAVHGAHQRRGTPFGPTARPHVPARADLIPTDRAPAAIRRVAPPPVERAPHLPGLGSGFNRPAPPAYHAPPAAAYRAPPAYRPPAAGYRPPPAAVHAPPPAAFHAPVPAMRAPQPMRPVAQQPHPAPRQPHCHIENGRPVCK